MKCQTPPFYLYHLREVGLNYKLSSDFEAKKGIFIDYEPSKLQIDAKYEFCKWTGLEWQEQAKKYSDTLVEKTFTNYLIS